MNQSLWKHFYGLVTFLVRVGDLYKISLELFFPVPRKMPRNLDRSILNGIYLAFLCCLFCYS